MSKIGNKTIQYSVYDRTEGSPVFVEDTSNVKRPSIETLTDTLKGAGIVGEIDFPTLGQVSSMEYEVTFKNTNKKIIVLFGQKTQHIEVRWVTDVLDSATGKVTTVAKKDIIKAIPKKLDLGTIESNSQNEATITLEIIYFNHIQNGVSLIEIDKLNNVLKIDGWDYAATIREAL